MNKRSTDIAWKAMFEVKYNSANHPLTVKMSQYGSWDIINVHNGEVMGNYCDQSFAIKQARRKYKKFIKLLEKNFTS